MHNGNMNKAIHKQS